MSTQHHAASDAFIRAVHLGYSTVMARQFARTAQRAARPEECSRATALRIVPPLRATLGEVSPC